MSRLCVVFFLIVTSALAQFGAGNTVRRVRVRVAFSTGICDLSTHVALTGHNGLLVENTANDQCEAEFLNIPEGAYHVSVSGGHLSNADAGILNMTSAGPYDFVVPVKPADTLDRNYAIPGNAFVSASGLGVPGRARKEFDRANALIGKQDFPQAAQRLNKAIAIYPNYAVAYNNLGVIYAHLGDQVRERESLQKAITLNDHLALAYVNLGRMDIAANDYVSAERVLEKASSLDPADPMALILLSYSEYIDRHYDEAIATMRKAHALGKPHAFTHRVAARAFEQKRQGAKAIEQLNLFLGEEPPGPRADAAQKELEVVKAVLP